ncbi:hypothetical protein [Riemerella anatipestifer]|uniref:hypothetical protein n=1 Tax=Riemerella anatipestifer TaxID=34085 RepID=UPI001372375F|nr:hypothetical protein [Riemerella anatipestifer]MBT0550244.1 hypothetical protein [Riemerella anatipestifer]MBT0556968.1 hypothetical protein [Riemerella anatipestifer]MBT0561004.1 hypothetical protein [Riemerella anatipestifer]NAV17325.1 hypothetical protein [Riemerella anatipestifer]
MKYKEQALDYFNRHPYSNECHITSDGRVFHTLGAAQSFAGTLEDQVIESFSRAVLKKAEDEKEKNKQEKKKKEEDKKLEGQKQAKENFEAADLSTLDYNALTDYVRLFELETADKKAETLRTVLSEYQAELKNKQK